MHRESVVTSRDKARATRKASLERVLRKNESIKDTVKSAASDLTSVNEVLQQDEVPVQAMKEALTQNEEVEQKVAKAADDLKLVNIKLTREVAERRAIETELADTRTDLAEVRGDLSAARAHAEEAQRLALHDPLTGLPNRVLFEHGLEHGLSQAKRHGWGLAVLFLDIDKFKRINDSHGHDLGDQVLRMVATRLRSFVRDEDIVSRWGGDEFACLCLEVTQEADVLQLAEKMIQRIAEACDFNGTTLSISASIGIALYPADGDTPDLLFKHADTAMYQAKATTKGVVSFRQVREGRAD